jgi:DNA-binding response OmpR family regulator
MECPRVLVVDDERSITSAVATILEQAHYDVEVAFDGPSAIEIALHKPLGLAVLDYQMPGMDGIELFREIRELQPDLQGVLLTSYTTIDKVFPAIDSGISRVLSKPVNAKELLPVVDDLIGHPPPDQP